MKNDHSFITRQQYRHMKNQHDSFYNQLGGSRPHVKRTRNSPLREYKIKRLSKRLDKIIAILILLIVIVYLVLIFVNF
ncbi:hypothetical protein HGK75_01830 [uncultured bacterium]|nr:hypothetical protein HGK75_01830 [uncultured bacterium]